MKSYGVTPIFIYHQDRESLVEHRLDLMFHNEPEFEDRTLCGIFWSDLPDVIFTREDGSTFTEPGDKPWYSDHDVDYAVPQCQECLPASV
jgi:hypothetical protein